jgi:prevent-host-death family protein
MLDLSRDIQSLSSFKRNTGQFVQQLKDTGEPVVLTINGRAELVVQDARSYQKLRELVDRLEAIAAIRNGMKELDEGKGLTTKQAKNAVRKKYGLSL